MEVNKTQIGQIFFALSILLFIYMLINPLTHVIGNIQEYFTLTLINFPISDILHISAGDTNPPLYYLLAKGFGKLITAVGLTSEMFYLLKIFSIIPYAIILIVSTTKIRKDYGWFTAGLFALAVGAMSELFIGSLLLRPYSWAVLFIILAFVFFRDALDDNKSLILFTAFSILAAYTHYYALITAVCLYIILLANTIAKNRDKIKYVAISIAAFVILYIPWIPSLINFLGSVNALGKLSLDSAVQSLSHFAYSGDTLFSIITLLIFIILAAIYFKDSEEDNTYLFAGIGAYAGTIVIILLMSVIIKPLLVPQGLLPASAILWLVISVMVSRIKGKRMFLISLALIALLLISGIGGMFATSDDLYKSGTEQMDTLEKIVQDDNAITVITSPNMMMYFLDYANLTDMYCINEDYVYGENMARLHEIFDFKNVDKDKLDEFATNNSDKNIYLISWGEPDVDVDSEKVSNANGIVFSKVKITPPQEEEYYY